MAPLHYFNVDIKKTNASTNPILTMGGQACPVCRPTHVCVWVVDIAREKWRRKVEKREI